MGHYLNNLNYFNEGQILRMILLLLFANTYLMCEYYILAVDKALRIG